MHSNGKQKIPDSYTTMAGHTVRLKAVSPLLAQEVYQSVRDPEPPTYTITTVTGDTEVHPLDAETAKTPEQQAAFQAYQAAKAAAERRRNDLMAEFLLMEGIEVDLPADLESWKRRMQRYGLDVPDDPDELRLAYIRRTIIGSAEDLLTIQVMVQERSGLTEGALARMEAMFQRAVERNTPAQPAAAQGSLDHEPDGAGDAGGQGMGGATAEPLL